MRLMWAPIIVTKETALSQRFLPRQPIIFDEIELSYWKLRDHEEDEDRHLHSLNWSALHALTLSTIGRFTNRDNLLIRIIDFHFLLLKSPKNGLDTLHDFLDIDEV